MSLGWHISIYRQQNDGKAPAESEPSSGTRLAIWETGIGGLNWLDKLAEEGQAIRLSRNGYPSEYTVIAARIILDRPSETPGTKIIWLEDPEALLTEKLFGGLTQDAEAIAACRPGEWLYIRAWDRS